jgi:hypothetical protein
MEKKYGVLEPFNAFNTEDEPQRISFSVVFAHHRSRGWAEFSADGRMFRLQQDDFERVTVRLD